MLRRVPQFALLVVVGIAACSGEDAPAATPGLSDGCTINSDCTTPLVCAFQRCHIACETSRDCPDSERCMASDRPFHVCQLPVESKCSYNSECPAGQVCGVDGQCRDQCSADRDCVTEQVCNTGTCAEPAELSGGKLPVADAAPEASGQPCSYDSECPGEFVCRAGLCAYECIGAADCPGGSECVSHRCHRPACGGMDGGLAAQAGAACQYDSECPASLVCRAKMCDCQCLGDRDCAPGLACVGNVCAVASDAGQPDASVDAKVEAGPDGAGGLDAAADAGTPTFTLTLAAGDGTQGYSGDNGPASQAQLGAYLSGMAVDAAGNLYIADSGNSRIRRVDASGTITTFAGNGTAGHSGDGAAATSAQIAGPTGVAVDTGGNVYFSEFNAADVRRVDALTGNISTYGAIGGTPTGIATDSAGDVYVTLYGNQQVVKIDGAQQVTPVAGNGSVGYSGDGGPATAAALSNPNGVWVDSAGNVFIDDSSNHVIRKVDTAGTITTVAGSGQVTYTGDEGPALLAGIDSAYGVGADAYGNLFISDTGHNVIRYVDGAGTIHTIAGNGTTTFTGGTGAALSAGLAGPGFMTVDGMGNVYFSDGNYAVYRLSGQAP